METPYFIFNIDLLDDNISGFKSGMKDNWPKCRLSYSVKTNSLPWLLSYLKDNDIMAEVVSDEEYKLAILCGYSEADIVFNGPIKTKECFQRAVEKSSYVNIDSKRELEWLKECKTDNTHIGIRINVPVELFDKNDIGYEEDGFRFGFSDETGELSNAIEILDTLGINGFGFHLHCNSVTRSPEVYRAIAKYAVEISEKYNLSPSFIDVGGGFFGGVPGKTTPDEYFAIIASELGKSDNTKESLLIAEPGSAIVGSTVDLHTSVLDTKNTAHARIVTTDGSRIHIDPLWIKSGYMHELVAKSSEVFEGKQIICGYTCMDHDRLMTLNGKVELQPGDEIIYRRVGAYTMTFGGPFIRYFPDVYVKDGGNITKVRSRISTEDYYKIHTV